MANLPNSQPWFQNAPGKGMQDRLKAIHEMRDPGTFADEILIGGRMLFILSLLFTGALCFFSYQFFLERFLSPEAATLAAIAVTILIEYGKKRIGMSALRMPFMHGWRYIFSTPENTGVFVGAAVFALVIFSVSVYNSTNGAARYAQQQSEVKTESVFTPNTKVLDEQIAAAREAVKNAPKATWKGKEYYQDKKSVRAAEQTILSLSSSREKEVALQREDFERSRDRNDTNNAHSGQIALRIGGWLELIQVILMLLMASCERVLDRRNPASSANSPTPPANGKIGFQQAGNLAVNQTPNQQKPTDELPQRQPIGFHRYSAQPSGVDHPVAQSPQPVPQENKLLTNKEANDAIRYQLSCLKKEPSNFGNKHAQPATVAKRVHVILDKTKHTLKWSEGCDYKLLEEYANYFDQKISQHLEDCGMPYDIREIHSLMVQKATA